MKSYLLGLAKVGLLGGVAFAGGMVTTLGGSSPARATSQDANPYAAVGQLGRVLVQIENNYVEPVDRRKIVEGAIKGMVEELDPHSSYLPPQDFALFQSETEGRFGGVGIEVDARGELLTVIAPIEGSPAARAGIKSGDRILTVDGEDARPGSLDKVVRHMRGVPGTHVKLVVRRDAVKEPLAFDLVREIIHVPSVAARMLDGGIAYVHVKQFQEHTHDELLAAAGRLRTAARSPDGRATMTGVVLDLRNNPGGLVDQAAEVADEFLTTGTIYTERHRGEVVDEVRARGGGAFADLPLVILVSEYSASASELVAGALQDQKRGTVVGANTFGKGSVQTIIDLPGGAGLRLTTARYYTPSGHSIQAEGIHPDILIEPPGPKVAEGLGPLRERDLEGHLPAQGLAAGQGRKQTILVSPDAGAPEDQRDVPLDADGTDAKSVPRDPMMGRDFALRVGYRVLREGRDAALR